MAAEFRRAEYEYEYGNYRKAIELFENLLNPLRISDEEKVVTAYQLLGISCFLENEREKAREAFIQVLHRQPDFHLNPVVIPPPIVEYFDDIRIELKPQLDEIRRRREEMARRQEAEVTVYIERKVATHSFLLNFFPFGVGQFQNGEKAKGVALLVSQAVSAGASLTAYTVVQSMKDSAGWFDHPGQARAWQVVQLSSGGLFFALYTLGVVDAIRHYQEEVSLETTRKQAPAKEVSGPSRRLLPSVAPGFTGLTMEWRM